jgi:hypothetical protein
MYASGSVRLRAVVLLALSAAAGCQRTDTPAPDRVSVEKDGVTYHLTGPYAHDNLSVFLLHAPQQDERDFITLDQGLKGGLVKVTEKNQEQVGELLIENRSEQPLFLQEGDRLQGGKQDRTIYASLVVPPNSGPVPVKTFCIEQGRWSQGALGAHFAATSNYALAPKATRAAAKYGNSQAGVWDSVKEQKEAAAAKKLAANTNSSLNETLDSPEVQKISDDFANALRRVLDEQPDAVGVAIAVNGKIEEVNIYPNHSLLGKLYPRLRQSYALQAALEKGKVQDIPEVACAEVARFMTEGKAKSEQEQALDRDNRLRLTELDNNAACATTCYQGKPVHQQVVGKSQPSAAARAGNEPANRPPAPQTPTPAPSARP